jgi:arylsulfatase A-like enzyme
MKLSRRKFLKAVSTGVLATAVPSALHFKCSSTGEKPNILLIFTDDQGYGDVGIHGNHDIDTPSLDALARESVRLDNFRSQSVCSPSRATLLTGRHFLKTGVWGAGFGRQYLNLDETTIADILQSAGYHTTMLGKWHLGKGGPYLPQARGFDDTWRLHQNHDHLDPVLDHNGTTLQVQGWTADYLTDRVIEQLKEKQHQPQFIYLAYPLIHEPFEAPDSLVQKYRARGFSDSLSTLYAMTEHLDQNVGRLMLMLDETGLKKNTIVLFIGDNGRIGNPVNMPHLTKEELDRRNPQGFRGLKGQLFEGGIRVPAFVSCPDKFQPRIVSENTDLTDILPTLLDVCDISVPDGNNPIDGVSLLPLLKGTTDTLPKRYLYYGNHEAGLPGGKNERFFFNNKNQLEFELTDLAVLYGGYKYISVWDGNLKALYNLDTDPSETTALNDSMPEIQNQLQQQMQAWWSGDVIENSDSYNMPTFFVGYPGEDINTAYAHGPSAIYGNVQMKRYCTINWRSDGDGQDIMLEVVESGRYKIMADFKVVHAAGKLEIVIGDQRLTAPIKKRNGLELGEINLSKGPAMMQIRLTDVPTNDQLIFAEFTAIKFQRQ